jgi:hypothetical protein
MDLDVLEHVAKWVRDVAIALAIGSLRRTGLRREQGEPLHLGA